MPIWKIACALIAVEHLGFMVLESFLFRTPTGRKIFALSQEHADLLAPMAFNQGIYNAFLSAGLVWAVVSVAQGQELAYFFLGCVLVAGLVGGASVKPTIYVLQALPAAIALVLLYLKL